MHGRDVHFLITQIDGDARSCRIVLPQSFNDGHGYNWEVALTPLPPAVSEERLRSQVASLSKVPLHKEDGYHRLAS